MQKLLVHHLLEQPHKNNHSSKMIKYDAKSSKYLRPYADFRCFLFGKAKSFPEFAHAKDEGILTSHRTLLRSISMLLPGC